MTDLDDLHPDLRALIGQMIHGRYEVQSLLGRGGMGAVFKAHHVGLRRDVAIKVLRPELGRDVSTGKRFDREAHSVSRLDHRNCVRVTDFGTTEGGVKYLVMELLEGEELEASLGQPWAPARAVDSSIQMLEGLEHAHHFGIVHRDLKPENVFVTRDFRGAEIIKLVDFGIAKLIDAEGAKEQLTRAGMIFGTPRYMSPEQASGGKLDERTDLYATGLILYQMLTGRPPFVSDDAALLLRMHILADPPALPPSVPEPLARVVAKLLEKSRNDRHASAREVIDELAQLRPTLAGSASAAAVPSPALTGPSATPSMETCAEVIEGSSVWQPAPAAAPTVAPSEPNAATDGYPHPAALTGHPGHPGHPIQPTYPSHDIGMITTYEPVMRTGAPAKPAQPWLPWVIGAAAIMVALMAFGAGQALQSKGSHPPDHAVAKADRPHEPRAELAAVVPVANPEADGLESTDMDCSDGTCSCRHMQNCELGCERDCDVRCTDAARCDITVGPDGAVFCDHFGSCEVECLGDCEVRCPQGGCDVQCPARADKRGKPKRQKPKKCGDRYLCGRDCDDDDD